MKIKLSNKYLIATTLMISVLAGFQNCSNSNFESAASLSKVNPQTLVNTQVMNANSFVASADRAAEANANINQVYYVATPSASGVTNTSVVITNSSTAANATAASGSEQPRTVVQAQQQPVLSPTDFNARNFAGCDEWNQMTGRNTVCAVVCNSYKGERCQNINPAVCIERASDSNYIFYSYANKYQNLTKELAPGQSYIIKGYKDDGVTEDGTQTFVKLSDNQNDCRSFRYFDKYIANGGTSPDSKEMRSASAILGSDGLSAIGFSKAQYDSAAEVYIQQGRISCYPQGRADCSKPEI